MKADQGDTGTAVVTWYIP